MYYDNQLIRIIVHICIHVHVLYIHVHTYTCTHVPIGDI